MNYEWLYDDTRLIIYDWWMISNLYMTYIGDRHYLPHEEHDKFIEIMKEDNITAVQVHGTTRYFNGVNRHNYWVLSFNSSKQATLFKLKYGQCL